MNNVVVIGRLTKDGTFQQVGDDKTSWYGNTIAVKRDFKNSNGEYDSDFIDFIAWKSTADFLNNYGRKGDLIGLSGSLRQNLYEDKDGVKHSKIQILVEKVTLMPNDKSTAKTQPELPEVEKNENEFEVTDDMLPF